MPVWICFLWKGLLDLLLKLSLSLPFDFRCITVVRWLLLILNTWCCSASMTWLKMNRLQLVSDQFLGVYVLSMACGPSPTTWPYCIKVSQCLLPWFPIHIWCYLLYKGHEWNSFSLIGLFVFLGGYFSGRQPVDFIQTAILTLCGQVGFIEAVVQIYVDNLTKKCMKNESIYIYECGHIQTDLCAP